ncbi:MAG: aminotransferase class I/II-fold pyridoxal phosphate-dependent enzyme [Candidatus Delongbacteria bacterium]|nr:aminotransferase class I/II-fold pyridoxal phosphate-dependent enzyme [Candidatus Delongbacteria bacterium]
MKQRIWLSPPHMSGNELKYIHEAFDTNWVAPLGPNVTAFENKLADYLNIKHAVALSSGSAAIHLALIILGVKAGDEVIASSFTFSATINPIVYQGAIPVLIDSEVDTWNMSPELLEIAIKDRLAKGKKPKVIIVVHLYGMPAKIEELMAISEKYEIPIIEDVAEALGSKYKGKALGTFGIMGIFSFNGNKIITTSGGGALVSNDNNAVEKAMFLATQARDSAPHYQHSQIGYNYRMSNIIAGIGRGQMEVLDSRVEMRRSINKIYKDHFINNEGISFLCEPSADFYSNYWLTTILIDPVKADGITSKDIRLALETDRIESRPLWKPMHLQPIFLKYPSYIDGVSEKLFNCGLCLPSGSNLNEEDIGRIVFQINKLFV